jgi:hypothetical protein
VLRVLSEFLKGLQAFLRVLLQGKMVFEVLKQKVIFQDKSLQLVLMRPSESDVGGIFILLF